MRQKSNKKCSSISNISSGTLWSKKLTDEKTTKVGWTQPQQFMRRKKNRRRPRTVADCNIKQRD